MRACCLPPFRYADADCLRRYADIDAVCLHQVGEQVGVPGGSLPPEFRNRSSHSQSSE